MPGLAWLLCQGSIWVSSLRRSPLQGTERTEEEGSQLPAAISREQATGWGSASQQSKIPILDKQVLGRHMGVTQQLGRSESCYRLWDGASSVPLWLGHPVHVPQAADAERMFAR